MKTELKPIYRYVLDKGVVTVKNVADKFECPEEYAQEKLDILTQNGYLHTRMIEDPDTGKGTKTYRSPIFDDE